MWSLLLQTNFRPRLSKLMPCCPPPDSARISSVRGSKEKSRPRRSRVPVSRFRAPGFSPSPRLSGERAGERGCLSLLLSLLSPALSSLGGGEGGTPARLSQSRTQGESTSLTLPPLKLVAPWMRLSSVHWKEFISAWTLSL